MKTHKHSPRLTDTKPSNISVHTILCEIFRKFGIELLWKPPTFNANKFLYFYKYLKSLLFNEPLEESALSLSLSLYLNIPQLSSPVQWSAECPGQPGPAGGSLAQCGPSARWTVWQKISAGWKPGELQLPASFLLQSAWQSDQSQWSSGRQLEKAELLRGLTRYNRPEPADIYLYF